MRGAVSDCLNYGNHRKILLVVIGVLLMVGVVIMSVFLSKKNTLDMNFTQEAELIIEENHYSLNMDEVELLKNMFCAKKLHRHCPACGFSKSLCVVFDKTYTFCFACDGCPFIYWLEEDRYFYLGDSEKELLDEWLELYGIVFPCI